MAFKIIPTGKRLFVEVDEVTEGRSQGGVILPEKHSELTRMATIIAMGERVNRDIFKEGDRIVIAYIAGQDLHFPQRGVLKDTHRIISEDNILCKIEDE